MSLLACSDHCYNEGDADEKRADAYMQAYERVIANTPWMPILGNHEYYVKFGATSYTPHCTKVRRASGSVSGISSHSSARAGGCQKRSVSRSDLAEVGTD